ncbi:MAG: hypothetical protein ACE5R6_21245 [Candidatus Heimdallarchaeota archaeon]
MSVYSSKTLVALTLISILLGVAIVEITPLGLRVYSPKSRLGGDQPVVPVFNIDITPNNISIRQGESGNLTVTLIDLPYPAESAITSETAIFLHINLNPYPSFTGILPEGVTATFNPSSVSLQPNGEANSTLMLKVDSVAPTGTYFLSVGGAWRWGEDRTSCTGTSFYLTVYGNNPPPPHPVHELKVKMVLIPGVYLDTPNTVNVCSWNYIEVLVWNFGSSREENVTVQIFVDTVKVREKTLSLAGYPETYDTHSLADTCCVVSKRWVPTSVKTYNITTVVFNPYNYAQTNLEVNVIGTQPLYLLTMLPLIILTLLLGGGTLAIIWVILFRRRMKIEDSHL